MERTNLSYPRLTFVLVERMETFNLKETTGDGNILIIFYKITQDGRKLNGSICNSIPTWYNN
jgi:hypothetical protein